MQSGDLDHLYEVLQRTEEKDSGGQKKWVWNKIGEFYGAEVPVSTSVFSSSGAMGSALVVQINYRPEDFPDLLPEHQLRDADSLDIYAITGILPVSRAKHRIMCAVGKNMTEISVQIEGLEDLQKQLERLVSLAEQEKYTFRAASYAMTPIVNQARLLAPMAEQAYFRYSKGRVLRKNNLARKKKYAGVAALYSNVAKERVGRGRVEVQPGGLKKAIRKIRVNLDKSKGVALQVRYGKAFYWRFLEYGTPHIRATPFLRPAYEMHKKTALERFKKRYAKYVDDVVKRKAIQEGDD